ncbi:hypothetical protein RB195_001133 [Necator americanus]|uniref:Mos1 transposase HTH domain-containing protein n=1 Tax=Necator americanus TaxID=51031 RepID=A0ABR1DCU1_NECAM
MILFVSHAKGGATGLLWHAIGTNRRITGARSTSSKINESQGDQGSNATRAARDICALYGDGATAEGTSRNWYAKFKNGIFDLKDAPRSGRVVELDEERLNQLLRETSRQTTRELAEKMEFSHTAMEKHLHSSVKVQRYGAWVPHALSVDNKNQRATISAGLLARHRATHGHKQGFPHRIVTGEQLL